MKVNAAKSGTGRTWERKFLGFQLTRSRRMKIAPESVQRFKAKVREFWRSCQSLTEAEIRQNWQQLLRGWWGYYRLSEVRDLIFQLEPWIADHPEILRWRCTSPRQSAVRELSEGPLEMRARTSNQRRPRIWLKEKTG